ncbi:MAG: DUF2807 domain-containing protein [Chloroflexota bacterium]|nr:MAG: DUF2807 domain-containing protein [Chloroflexota bacterium]
MLKRFLVIAIVLTLAISACSIMTPAGETVRGSGNVISETRAVSGFTSISVEGSADVDVVFGTTESLVIEAEDNILPLIETVVQNNRLIIRTRPQTSITTTRPIQVSLTMISLEGVSMTGSGSIDVPELSGDSFSVKLPGSGSITIAGTANSVDIDMLGSGTIDCEELEARNATVDLGGSGTVRVYASESLDATLTGSGNIWYSGDPAMVNKTVTGSGSIQE